MLTFERVREAAYAYLRKTFSDYDWAIVATFMDAVIVSRTTTGKLERYPVSVAADGAISLGTAEPVEAVYQKLTEALLGTALLGPIALEEGQDGASKKEWACVVIEAGLSANRRLYTDAALQGAVKLFENAQVFWNHDTKADLMRDPRDLAGFLKAPKVALLEATRKTAILATFRSTHGRAQELLTEAFEAGNSKLFGLSIHAGGEGQIVRLKDGPAYRVDSITAVQSVDLVSKPAAGGRFLRLVAGQPGEPVTDKELEVMDKKLLKLKESHPAIFANLRDGITEGELDKLIESLEQKPAPAPPVPVPAPVPAPAVAAVVPAGLSEADKSLLIEGRVDRLMKGKTLPEPLQEPTRKTMVALLEAGSPEATVAVFLKEQIDAAAKMVEGTKGSGLGASVEVQKDEAEKSIKALHGFFAGADVDGVGRFRSIREAYRSITGDDQVTGLLREAKGLGRFSQLFEGLQSGTWANVLASSLNRQLVQDYAAEGGAYADTGAGWLFRTVPVNDFRTRERVRFGGYGNLSGVAERAAYPLLSSPTDEKATYAVTKRGGIESVTFEMVRNDDVGAVQEIPRRMARAARRTLYEFAHDMYATNPAIYDAVALFHASHGGNLGAAALAANSFAAARLAMKKQTEKNSAKRVGLVLRHLMVPEDLAEAAYNLFVRDTNLDAKFVQTAGVAPTVHVITHLTDATDWFACAGIDQTPQIELAFLDGREDPELFVADMPNGGSLFAADAIDYKLRHIYGGAVLDYRGFYGAYGI